MQESVGNEPGVLHLLQPGEALHATAKATDAILAVTDHRLIVAANDRLALDVPVEAVRRIQFDVERGRPATLVIVPELPSHEPQVLAVPAEAYPEAIRALILLAQRLAQLD